MLLYDIYLLIYNRKIELTGLFMIEYDKLNEQERNYLDDVLKSFGVIVEREEYENYGFETVAINLKPILNESKEEYIDIIINMFKKLPFIERIETVAMECKLHMNFEEFRDIVLDAHAFFFGEVTVNTKQDVLDTIIDCGLNSFYDFTSSAVQRDINGYIIDLEDIPSYFGEPGMEMESFTSPVSAIYTSYESIVKTEHSETKPKGERQVFEKNMIKFLKCISNNISDGDIKFGIGFPIS